MHPPLQRSVAPLEDEREDDRMLESALSIRLALPSDADEIAAFDHVAITTPAGRASIRRSVDTGHCFVAVSDRRVVGYAMLEYTFYENAFLSMLYVAEPFRRRGFGAALVQHIECECRTPKLFTSTNESNKHMRCLLTKLGFEPSGIIENLDDGDPELVFVKRLRP
jgi:GNAT superfamily N-acetyltransferase